MRPENRDLDVPAGVATGTPLNVFKYRVATIQIAGTFVATIQIEGRLTGSGVWSPIGSPITAPGFVDLPHIVNEIRANVTAFTSGTPAGYFAGFNERTDN